MKLLSLLYLLLVSVTIAYSQSPVAPEKLALDCLNSTLSVAGKDANYLLSAATDCQQFLNENKAVAFEVKQQEVMKVLTQCKLLDAEQLNAELLNNCIENAYEAHKEGMDTNSSFYQLREHVRFMANNYETYRQLSPQLQNGAMQLIKETGKEYPHFYEVMAYIVYLGTVKEFENFLETQESMPSPATTNPGVVTVEEEQFIAIPEEQTEIKTPDLSNSPCGEDVFVLVDKMPEFDGDKKAQKQFLYADAKGVDGKVYLNFVIDCTGQVIHPQILRGFDTQYDQVALDLVSSMPNWIPGEQNGKKVSVQMTYVVTFR
ncbi:MAG: energy transducer TonB [Salibacteraceae bacterium]